MPNTPSAIKRLKQSKKRRLRNRIAKKVIRTYSKRAMTAAAEGQFDKAEADFRFAIAKLDKASARTDFSSEHGDASQEQADPRLQRGGGQGSYHGGWFLTEATPPRIRLQKNNDDGDHVWTS